MAKIGTLRCWLLGHKFIWTTHEACSAHRDCIVKVRSPADFCVRCGIRRSEAVAEEKRNG